MHSTLLDWLVDYLVDEFSRQVTRGNCGLFLWVAGILSRFPDFLTLFKSSWVTLVEETISDKKKGIWGQNVKGELQSLWEEPREVRACAVYIGLSSATHDPRNDVIRVVVFIFFTCRAKTRIRINKRSIIYRVYDFRPPCKPPSSITLGWSCNTFTWEVDNIIRGIGARCWLNVDQQRYMAYGSMRGWLMMPCVSLDVGALGPKSG